MILERGNMWDVFGKTDLFLVTTNPIVRKDGAVVMGRGIALQMKTRFPEFPYAFAHDLQRRKDEAEFDPDTGVVGVFGGQLVGFFMVKTHWRDKADLDVIAKSANALRWKAANYRRVDLNFPGTGNGKLNREDVLPIISMLPDNVFIWEKDDAE